MGEIRGKYCLICGTHYGPHVSKCCSPTSLVDTIKVGWLFKKIRYIDRYGNELFEASPQHPSGKKKGKPQLCSEGRYYEAVANAILSIPEWKQTGKGQLLENMDADSIYRILAYFNDSEKITLLQQIAQPKRDDVVMRFPLSRRHQLGFVGEQKSERDRKVKAALNALKEYNELVANIFANIRETGHTCSNCGETTHEYRLSEGLRDPASHIYKSKSLIICRRCGHVVDVPSDTKVVKDLPSEQMSNEETEIVYRSSQSVRSKEKSWLRSPIIGVLLFVCAAHILVGLVRDPQTVGFSVLFGAVIGMGLGLLADVPVKEEIIEIPSGRLLSWRPTSLRDSIPSEVREDVVAKEVMQFALLFAFLGATCAGVYVSWFAPPIDTRPDVDKIQGTWVIYQIIAPKGRLSGHGMKIVFDGDQVHSDWQEGDGAWAAICSPEKWDWDLFGTFT